MKKYIVFSILALSLFASCRKVDESVLKANRLQIPINRTVDTLDPANSYDAISAQVVYQLYETLYEYHYLKRPYSLKPNLASDLPIFKNKNKTVIIKIKKNIQYHDNPSFKEKPRFLKSEDFITQIKRLAFVPTKSNGWWLFDGKIKGINKFREQAGSDLSKFKSLNIEGLKAPDDHTLVIELNEPYPQIQYALAMSFAAPVPMETVLYYKNTLNDVDVGTGPYYLKKWNRGLSIKVDHFKNYRLEKYPKSGDRASYQLGLLKDAGKKLPLNSGIDFHIIKEDRTRWLNFLSKKLDLLVIPTEYFATAVTEKGELSPELKKKSLSLQIAPTLTYYWLSFNMKDELVGKNLNLRKAFAYAINMDEYINKFTNKIGQKANSIYVPGIAGYNPTKELPYEYNLDKAKEFLKQAGYPAGEGLPEITFDVRADSTKNRLMAEFIQKELAKIGVKIKVNTNTFPAFLKKSRTGNLQFWQDGWMLDYPDSENIIQLLVTNNLPPGPNATYYSNKAVDKMFNELKSLQNNSRKFELMNQIEDTVMKDIPWIMQFYSRNYILYNNRLKNFRHGNLVYNYYKYLSF